MSEQSPTEVVGFLLESWTTKLADSLEGMTGERPTVAWHALEAPPLEAADTLWWEQPLSISRTTIVWTGAPEKAWHEIGAQILGGAGIEVSDPQDARNTYLEVLSQTSAGFAQTIGRRLGTEVTCGAGKENSPPPPDTLAFEVVVTLAGTELPGICLCLSSPMLDQLRTDVSRPAATVPEQAAREGSPAPPMRTGSEQVPRTLDLLMEVELPVSVSFGRAQLPLKEVLKLSTGSIVELNRAISEPVEVIVNNCVIARGEVVVVEGNYGVRIHEIISREKRLRTLQ